MCIRDSDYTAMYHKNGIHAGFFSDIYMYKNGFVNNMRQKLITLDDETSKMAQDKTNFSEWVRNQLRSERTKSEVREVIAQLEKDAKEAEKNADYWYEAYLALKVKK